MKLYPRLPLSLAAVLTDELRALEPAELFARSSTSHDYAIYGATGGSRVRETELAVLQEGLREAAGAQGPGQFAADRAAFDRIAAQVLHAKSGISPAEASRPEVWAFLTCVLVPDVVRWRFPGRPVTAAVRFFETGRGTRNTLARLWWRAFTLKGKGEDPYRLLRELGEDQLVQLMERTSLAGSSTLAFALGSAFADWKASAGQVQGSEDIFRDVTKRARRALAVVDFDYLSAPHLKHAVNEMLAASAVAFGASPPPSDLLEADIPSEGPPCDCSAGG